MLDAVVPAALQHVRRADDVAVDVREWILDRIPHARLRGQVDHALEFLAREQRRHAGAVGQVELDEAEPGLRLQLLEPCVS